MSPPKTKLIRGVVLLALLSRVAPVFGVDTPAAAPAASSAPAPAATATALPPLPAPMNVPKPAAATDAPYQPQPILPGGVVVPLFPPDSPYLKKERLKEAEVYNMNGAMPGRIGSIVNIHNPSIEFHAGVRSLNTGMAVIVVAGGGHRTLNVGGEGADFVHFFANYGINTIILRNRMRVDGYDAKTDSVYDAQQAIKVVRAYADKWQIDPKKIGITGCSGGGTLSSYIMALDDRVTCAAPSCYLTTFRRLIETIGPQDAEQNIFGQVDFGLDQPDYLLMRAPRPTMISCTSGDFFDIAGTWDNYRQAKRIFGKLGYPERIDLVEAEVLEDARRLPERPRQPKRVDHHVADEVDALGRDALAREVQHRGLFRGEQIIGDRVGGDAVDLLRSGVVDLRVALSGQEHLLVARERALDGEERRAAADDERNHRVREHDDVPERHHGKSDVGVRGTPGAILHGTPSLRV